MLGKLINYTRSRVFVSYYGKKILHYLLGSAFFIFNPFYRLLFCADIKRKIQILQKKPTAVIIENTNFCNISCVFCANEKMKRKRGFMHDDLFRAIIDQCAYYKVATVVIQGFGEPLLDKNYIQKIAYTKDKGIANVYCVTNGILLSQDISDGFIKVGLDNLCISIDAVTAETYGTIHRTPGNNAPSDKFSVVIENIERLLALKKKYRAQKPFVELRFKDFDKNKTDLSEFIRKYRGRIDNLNIYMNITNWPGSSIKNNLPQGKILKFPCYNLWSTLYITHEGKVSLCCQDYECRYEIGDICKENIMEVWSGKVLNLVRQLHLKNKYSRVNVCNDCVVNTHYVAPWWPAI